MSVLSKGMEMPSRCNMCQLRDLCFDYYICRAKKLNDGLYLDVDDVKDRRHIKCPLVEVPTPHGDLVDRDDLIDEINRVTFAERYDYNVAYDIVKSAETVIEMEE